MDTYSTAFCLPRLTLARANAPPANDPSSPTAHTGTSTTTTTTTAATPLPPPPAIQRQAPTPRKHAHSQSHSSIIPPRSSDFPSAPAASSSTSGAGTSGAPGSNRPHHLSRPASLASLAETAAANDAPSSMSMASSPVKHHQYSRSHFGSIRKPSSPPILTDLGPPGGHRRSAGTAAPGVPGAIISEPSSATSSVSTHRTSASLGSNIPSASSATSASSLGGGGSSSSAAGSGATGSSSTIGPSPSTGSDGTQSSETEAQVQELTDAMHRLASDIMARHHCLMTFDTMKSSGGGPSPSSASVPLAGSSSSTGTSAHRRNSVNETLTNVAGLTANAGVPNTMMPLPDGKGFNVHIHGGYQQVMAARGYLHREAPFLRRSIIRVPRAEVLDTKSNVRGDMKTKLDHIASITEAHLAITKDAQQHVGFGLETDSTIQIIICGSYDNVEQARVRLLVLLDELSGLDSAVCEIDHKMHNIAAGRKRQVVRHIQEETGTNIYFPSPFGDVFGVSSPDSAIVRNRNLIFITGEPLAVNRARDMLYGVSFYKSKDLLSRDAILLPRKLDWLLTERLDDLKQSMSDNGTFIHFPLVGSVASVITVYGDHRVGIERTLRYVMQLTCEFYSASVWLLPSTFDVYVQPPAINNAPMPSVLQEIAANSGAEVVFKSNCFELYGLESEVRQGVQMITKLDMVKPFLLEIRFSLELANEHRDFISGKKNGKLNKIMKAADAKIKFETFNDYNFLIELSGNHPGALNGLTLLQEELPAELSFHIPEVYHKRIIGVGGNNIQRIMKEHGVYVKFSNAEEFAAHGGYADTYDNVVARTPAKNGLSLDGLKQSVMEMVAPRDKDFITELVSIPRRYHRGLLSEKAPFLQDITRRTNCIFQFPNKETASDIVVIFGPESKIHLAASNMLQHIPLEGEFRLPHSTEMAQLVLSNPFLALLEQIRRDFQIHILPFVDRTGSGDDTILQFMLTRSNTDVLGMAKDSLVDFLVANNIPLYPGTGRSQPEPRLDPFLHFNSAILSTNNTPQPLRQDQQVLMTTGEMPSLQRERSVDAGMRNMTFAAPPPRREPDLRTLFDGQQNIIPFPTQPASSGYMASRPIPPFAPLSPIPGAAAQQYGYQRFPDTDTVTGSLANLHFS